MLARRLISVLKGVAGAIEGLLTDPTGIRTNAAVKPTENIYIVATVAECSSCLQPTEKRIRSRGIGLVTSPA
jgi:hypothetical protein